MLLNWDDIEKLSVRKSKARAYKRQQDIDQFVADFKNEKFVLSKKQAKEWPLKAQLELPLDIPDCDVLEYTPRKRRRKG